MTCTCPFDADPITHDRLLGIETMDPVEAVMLVLDLIALEDLGTVDDFLFRDTDDFGQFVAQHNWRNPVAMYWLGLTVNSAMERVKDHRYEVLRQHKESQRELEASAPTT